MLCVGLAACAPATNTVKPQKPPAATTEVVGTKPEARPGDTARAGSSLVDGDKLADSIRERATRFGVAITKVTCPGDVVERPGVKFSCQVAIEGMKKTRTIDVTIRELDKSGNWIADTAWHDGADVMVAILVSTYAKELSRRIGATVSVACDDEPPGFPGAKPGLRCDVASGEATTTATFAFAAQAGSGNWTLGPPPLVGSAELAKGITPIVRAKTNPRVDVDCGPKPVFVRPADGVIWCALTDGAKHAKLRIEVDDEIYLLRWEIVPAP